MLAILVGIAAATALAGVARYASGFSAILAFVLATLSLAGLAWIVSFATEQIGERVGPAITGFLQSTLGNLPEFFVVIFALNAGARIVAGDPELKALTDDTARLAAQHGVEEPETPEKM